MRERTEGEELYNCFGGDKWEKVIYCILKNEIHEFTFNCSLLRPFTNYG